MKKIILLTLLTICVSSFSYAQIQTSFFGSTLGVSDRTTTFSNMNNYFHKTPFSSGPNIISVNSVNYANYEWDKIDAIFDNNKLGKVCFYCNKATQQELDNKYQSIEKSLDAKYGALYYNFRTLKGDRMFGINYSKGDYGVSLIMRYKINNNKKVYTGLELFYLDYRRLNQPDRYLINDKL